MLFHCKQARAGCELTAFNSTSVTQLPRTQNTNTDCIPRPSAPFAMATESPVTDHSRPREYLDLRPGLSNAQSLASWSTGSGDTEEHHDREEFETLQHKVKALCNQIYGRNDIDVEYMRGGSFNRVVGVNFSHTSVKTLTRSRLWSFFSSLLGGVRSWAQLLFRPFLCGLNLRKDPIHHVIRIPRSINGSRDELIADDVVTHRFARTHLGNLVPEILTFDATIANPSASRYMMQQRLSGLNLNKEWQQLNFSQKKSALRGFMEVMASLQMVTGDCAGVVTNDPGPIYQPMDASFAYFYPKFVAYSAPYDLWLHGDGSDWNETRSITNPEDLAREDLELRDYFLEIATHEWRKYAIQLEYLIARRMYEIFKKGALNQWDYQEMDDIIASWQEIHSENTLDKSILSDTDAESLNSGCSDGSNSQSIRDSDISSDSDDDGSGKDEDNHGCEAYETTVIAHAHQGQGWGRLESMVEFNISRLGIPIS
ncbi:hypothetical protein J1614_002317 [Plenodomus biglobosus]|nr:hypothetical protein J1614_002317 [Plenodomus biglobosus]